MNNWIGLVIGLASLCLVVGGSIFTFGRRQGKTDEKVNGNCKDINTLWDHQRIQDDQISCIEKTMPEMATDIKWIKKAMGGGQE